MIADDIFAWAERTPGKTAIRHNGRPISYAAFAEAIRKTEGLLAIEGYEGPGIAIVAVRNLANFWILSLALRGRGLTTFAINSEDAVGEPGLPEVRCVATTAEGGWEGLPERCTELGYPLLVVPSSFEAAPVAGKNTHHSPGGHILRTSGTTGTSKKLLMEPEFERDYHAARRDLLGIDSDTVCLVFDFPPWTGAGYKSAVTVWAAGGTLVLWQQRPLAQALREPGLTQAVLVPTKLAELLAVPAGFYARSDRLHLSIAGGAATAPQIEAARRRITPHLYNRLSSTEASIIGYTRLDGPEDRRWHRLVPGRAVEIVDEEDRPVPTGEVGRLRISTAGGPTGYFNHPEETRQFFRDGFFYTGDLAAFRADGRMALHGRVTEVINFRGTKLSPGPVEERLREAFGVDGVCIFSMQDDGGEEQMHVVIEHPTPPDAAAFVPVLRKEFLGTATIVTYMPRLPRTESGKVLRNEVQKKVMRAN